MKSFSKRLSASVFITCSMMLICCKKNDTTTFSLLGDITGDYPQKIVLQYVKDTIEVRDTTEIVDGKFKFTGTIDEPTLANFNIVDGGIWIEPGEMTVSINMDDASCVMSGSKTQAEQVAFNQKIDSIGSTLQNLGEQIATVKEQIAASGDAQTKSILTKKQDSLTTLFSQNQVNPFDIQVDFIKKNPDSYYSAYLLYPLNASEIIPLDSAMTLYDSFDNTIKESYFGNKIATNINLLKQNRIGEPAPEFEVNDPIHNCTVKLSDLRGKIVLLDFWAPWCSPCRFGFRHIKEIYKEYASKGFEVIAVYTDSKEDKAAWRKAIADDEISDWHHVKIAENMASAESTDNDIRSKYYVQAIPRKILIDQQGNIVKIWVGTSINIDKEMDETITSLLGQ